MTTVIEGYLKPNVKDGKDPLARQSRKEMTKIVKGVGGKLVRFEVVCGVIFVDTDKEEASNAIVKCFAGFKEVTARVINTLEAIFRKSQLRPMQEQ